MVCRQCARIPSPFRPTICRSVIPSSHRKLSYAEIPPLDGSSRSSLPQLRTLFRPRRRATRGRAQQPNEEASAVSILSRRMPARVERLSPGQNSRARFSTGAGLDSTHGHRVGRFYRDSELSLGLCSHKLIRESNTLPIATGSRVQVDGVEKARSGWCCHGNSASTHPPPGC